MDTRLVYRSAVEGIFLKAYGAELSAEQQQRIKTIGIDLAALRPAYDVAVYDRALAELRQWMHPTLADDEAYEAMGLKMVNGYLDTTWAGFCAWCCSRSPHKHCSNVPRPTSLPAHLSSKLR